MFEAQLLYGATSPGLQVYSPWFPRRGDNAIFTIDFINGAATVKVEVFSKAAAEPGDGTQVTGSFTASSSSSPPQVSGSFSGFKELVRYRYSVTDASTKFALFRMLAPVWWDTVKVWVVFEAQLLYGAAGRGLQIYSPWFPRRGDNAMFTIDFVGGAATIAVEVFSKDVADAGDGTQVTGSFTASSSTSPPQKSGSFSGLKDLVRYRYTVTDASTKFALFRMLAPVWWDTVKVWQRWCRRLEQHAVL
jgi:hypothetical protein